MRKRYLVGYAVLLAIAALTPFIRRTFYPAGSTGPVCRMSDAGQTIRQTAGKYSIPMIDVSNWIRKVSPLSDDGVHLSRDGSIQWTSIIESAVSRQCP